MISGFFDQDHFDQGLVYRYWLSFFPLCLSVKAGRYWLYFFLCLSLAKRGFHPVVQRPFVLREKVFPVTVQRRDGFLFAIAKLWVT